MKDQVNNILQKRMDRKGFLKHVGVGMAALMGVTALVKTLNPTPTKGDGAYGAASYGGVAKKD